MAFHFYSTDYTYDDEARSFSYSDIETDEMGLDHLFVRVERMKENGSDFAEMELPYRKFVKAFGFSEDELFDIENYIILNEPLILDMVREG